MVTSKLEGKNTVSLRSESVLGDVLWASTVVESMGSLSLGSPGCFEVECKSIKCITVECKEELL